MITTWRTRCLLVVFCLLTIVTTFVNKHVLSNLKFTYPTIFQSWQAGTVFVVLLSLSSIGYIDLNIQLSCSSVILSWLPASLLFAGRIYSGSVALSRLSVPIFCVMHYTTTVLHALLDWFILKKAPSLTSQISLVFIAIATLAVAESDPQFDSTGYVWMMIHCGFSALYLFYGKTRKKNSLSEVDKMFLDALTSVIILMGISIVTGELFTAVEFPFLYSTHFHVGCMASGIFGAGVGLSEVLLLGTEVSLSMGVVHSLNKVFVCLFSLFLFEVIINVNTASGIVIALSSGIFYSYAVIGHKENDVRSAHPVHDS